MKKYLLSIVTFFALVLVVGCGSKSNALVGKWNGKTNDGLETTFTFEKNGKVAYENQFGIKSEGTYEIKNKKSF